MKKLTFLLTALLAFMLLAACNQSSNNASGEVNVDEILDKSIKAMSELKSYSMDMNLDQEMNIPGEDTPTIIKGKIKADLTLEPFAMHQTMTLTGELEDMSFDAESYMTEDGFFMSNPEDNSWMKAPGEFAEEMKQAQASAEDQLKLLKGFSEEITMTEEGNDYVLTVKGSGEKFMELTKELLQNMGGSAADSADMLSMMDMKQINFVIHIDKETFYQTKIDLDMELEMTVEEETMSMKQKMNGTLSNFNKVEAIVIPEDIKNNAEEINLDIAS